MDFLHNPYVFASLSAGLVLLLAQFLFRKVNKRGRKKKKYHPIGGTVFNQLMNFNRLHHYMTDLAGKYKTYRLLSPFRNEVYTSDPINVEYILKTHFENYGKGMYNYQNLRDFLGDGIFTVDGEKWREQRKISSHEFSTKMLRDFSIFVFRKNAAKVANVVSEATTSNKTLEIQDLLMKSTLDSIFQVAFGTELDSMCGSSEEGKNFAEAFEIASMLTLYRYVDVFWKIKKFLNVGSEAVLRKNTKILNDFVFKLINTRIQQLQISKDDSTYPEVQEKAAEEVKEATNTKTKTFSSGAEFVSFVTDEALEKMHYLHAAITETLRLYPAVPVDAKICFGDDTLPDGYNVNKGDMVSYQPYAMGRMKFIWGDDAEEFRPERWLDHNGIFQPESPFKFTAFQAGPRICLGKEFAYRQMKIFSAVLLGCFRFELNDEKKVVTYKTMINLHIDGGLEVKAFHRHWVN
ncbi:hypothetical protein PIB30_025128 [Stylosanthes scabra]|uniref:Cytochrome P450 monooxygenase n=1 Tax=Stylosanthes scabra TaxID=79078 RepID=A0ABU6WA59_9FABA|nr:hypothetical protein [Stylosanthes scabra]